MTEAQFIHLQRDAQRTANRDGAPVAIYNLNRVGAALLVIRAAREGAQAYAGPFYPLSDAAALQLQEGWHAWRIVPDA